LDKYALKDTEDSGREEKNRAIVFIFSFQKKSPKANMPIDFHQKTQISFQHWKHFWALKSSKNISI
jgi:hypothetical protein